MRKILSAVVLAFGTYITAQTYCTPSFLEGCDDGDMIDTFVIPNAGFNHASTGCSTGSYGDFTSLNINLSAGLDYQYSISHDYSSQQVRIWVDFNNDGTFDDAAPELVSMASSSGTTTTGTILIPSTVPVGSYRMRVGDRYSSQPIPCNTDGYGEIHDYTLVVSAPPTCMAPSNITVTSVGTTNATLGWTLSTSTVGIGYEYYYSTTNTAPTSATTALGNVGSTATSAPLTSLTPGATYYTWVRAICTNSDKSVWYPGPSFTTNCLATNLPYLLDFDATTPPDIPQCTLVTNDGTGNNWGTYDLSLDPSYGLSGNVLRYLYNFYNPANTWFFTQGLNLTGGVTYRVRFKYATNAGTLYSENLKVAYGTSSNSSAMNNTIVNLPSLNNTTATQGSYFFTPTSNGVYYIGFHAYSDINQNSLYVDDIQVSVAPSCNEPIAVSASAITSNSAQIAWTVPTPTPSNGYEYYYNTTGIAPTPTTAATGVSPSTSVSLSTLSPATTYYIWVRSVCSSTDKSEWSTKITITTECVPGTLPLNENFDAMTNLGSQILPNCWITTGSGTSGTGNYFTSADASGNIYNDPNSGNNYVTIYFPYGAPAYLWTPEFNLTAGQTYSFSFSWVGDDTDGWEGKVYASSSASVNGATQLGTAFVTDDVVTSTSYTPVTYSFTPSTTGLYRFGIETFAHGFSPNYLGFDDFSLVQGSLSTSEIITKIDNINVYPNPFTDIINITNSDKVQSVSVVDTSGKLLKTFNKIGQQIQLNELSTGLYFITIKNVDGTQKTFKVIKK